MLLLPAASPLSAGPYFELFWRDQLDVGQPLQAKSGKHPDLILREAYSAELRHSDHLAQAKYAAYFKSGGEGAFARLKFAVSLERSGHLEKALEQSNHSLILAPHNSKYAIYHINLLRKGERYRDALLFALEKQATYSGAVPGLEFHLAELHNREKKLERAYFHYRQTLFHIERAGPRKGIYRDISLWRLANHHLRLKQPYLARAYLETYIKRNPGSHYARFILADHIYLQIGEYLKARNVLDELAGISRSKLSKQKIPLRYLDSHRATAYYLTGDVRFLEAINFIKYNYEMNARERGMLYEWQKRDGLAMRFLLPVLKKNPGNLLSRESFLKVLARSNRADLYLPSLLETSRIATRYKNFYLARRSLAEAYRIKKAHPELKIAWEDIEIGKARLFARQKLYHRAALALRQAQKYISTEKKIHKSSRQSPEKIKKRKLLLERLIPTYMGRSMNPLVFQEGLLLARRLYKKEKSDPRNAYLLARLLLRAGRWQEAVVLLETVQTKQKYSSSRFLKLAAQHELGQDKKVQAELRAVIAAQDANIPRALTCNMLAYLLAIHGEKLEEALQLSRQAVEDDLSNGHYRDTLGFIYYRLGKYTQAYYHLEAARSFQDANGKPEAVVLAHLADVHLALNNKKKARAYYLRAMRELKRRNTSHSLRPLDRAHQKLQEVLPGKLQSLTP